MRRANGIALVLFLTACNSGEVITIGGNGGNGSTSVGADFAHVIDYTPAPGQFIGEKTAGFTGSEVSPEDACAYAEERLRKGLYVSLGGFGGSLTVAFDHDIAVVEGYSLAIAGNQIEASNEPGIVWVMEDTNRNLLPDDEWYELVGSDSEPNSPKCRRNYSVTYFRPAAGEAVRWIDSEGTEGEISRVATHKQDSYYPSWITADSYTLHGTRLAEHNFIDSATGQWVNPPYDWGYVDNFGSDTLLGSEANGLTKNVRFTLFSFANAVDSEGNKANITSVHFVRIQSALNTQSGVLGECSTEVLAVKDYVAALNGSK